MLDGERRGRYATRTMVSRALPRPFLKWAGGKTQLLPEILARLPATIKTYYEPFLGGGAVFFALARAGRLERAVLGDSNGDLLAVYQALKEDPQGLIELLDKMKLRHSEEEYYRVRASKPRTLLTRAARVVYMNRTGYNGLYRVNRAGEFNVPFGRYKNPRICDPSNLHAAAEALRNVELVHGDFAKVCARAVPGDAVYFDPPYLPLSATANFKEYVATPFGLEEHQRLANEFAGLARRGVALVLSNSYTDATRELYARYQPELVNARRAINSNAARRGKVTELLVVAGGARPQARARSRA